MKKALLISLDHYPDGDAGAVRTHMLSKILISLGYEPTVIGLGESTNFQFRKFDEVKYMSLRSPSNSVLSKVINRVFFIKRLRKIAFESSDAWDLVLFSEVSESTLKFLKKWHKKNNIPLIHDSVEWYSKEQFRSGRFNPIYMAKNRLNEKLLDRNFSIIAISSFLDKHFSEKGIKSVRIPVIMNTDSISFNKNTDEDKVVFSYAGSPGKKDYLNMLIQAAAKLNTDKSFEIRLIGIKKEQLYTVCGVNPEDVELLGDKLVCLGRIPRAKVLEQLGNTDYTVLIRSEEQRYAKAGFPTKFVESLATATPVIANLTSDLGMYLIDGKNGFVVENETGDALAKTMEKALDLTFQQRKEMQNNARRTAEENFDYHLYCGDMEKVIM